LNSEADEFIGFAVDGAMRMQTLIRDLLSYSRVMTQGRSLQPVDTQLTFDTAFGNLQKSIEDSGAIVSVGALPTVHADATQLTQLFQNLIGNALKYRNERAPRIQVSVALTPHNLMWSFFGVLVGNLIGVLPGMGALSAIAMLLPLTYTMHPLPAILMLAGIFYGSQYGGAIGAILLNLPSHPPHAVTCLDGYPMTCASKGGTALGITMIASFFAASFGIIVMIFASPLLVQVALKFGPAEIFAIMLLGLLAGATMARGSPLKDREKSATSAAPTGRHGRSPKPSVSPSSGTWRHSTSCRLITRWPAAISNGKSFPCWNPKRSACSYGVRLSAACSPANSAGRTSSPGFAPHTPGLSHRGQGAGMEDPRRDGSDRESTWM
jgi:hypothetical protein